MAFLGLHPVWASKAFTLAALTVCPVKEAPQYEVLFTAQQPSYNETQPSATLKVKLSANKDSTLATDTRATVFGVTTSDISGRFHVTFKGVTDQKGSVCVYIDKATFAITYAPQVFISSEILDMACSYRVTKAHEQQHVAIDTMTVQQYLPYLRMDIQQYLRALGSQGFGPFPLSEVEQRKSGILDTLMKASDPMLEKLKESRRKWQGSIDTLENYRRESDKCPEDAPQIMQRFRGGR